MLEKAPFYNLCATLVKALPELQQQHGLQQQQHQRQQQTQKQWRAACKCQMVRDENIAHDMQIVKGHSTFTCQTWPFVASRVRTSELWPFNWHR